MYKGKASNLNQQLKWVYTMGDTQWQPTFCRRVLMLQSMTTPKEQTYVNETYILMRMRWHGKLKTNAHAR